MSTAGKIRVLLVLLCASLFFTTVIVKNTYTPVNSLYQTSKTLEENLHKKENYVLDLLNDKEQFKSLKTLQQNSAEALNLVQTFTTDRTTWFTTFYNNRLAFWSGIKIIPDDPASIKEGCSIIDGTNGRYEVIKKSEGSFSAIFFIPIRINYAFQNQFLQNEFSTDLLKDNDIQLADFTDKNVYEIHSVTGVYLFSVKLIPGKINQSFFRFELILWTLTILALCLLVQNICSYFASKGRLVISVLILAGFIVVIRYLNIHYSWPSFTYKLDVFNPAFFSSGPFFKSLGDFCINLLSIFWFVIFLHSHREEILTKIKDKITPYILIVIGTGILIFISTGILNIFYGLVINSKINFDVSNVLNLSFFSFLGVLMLCFAFLIFFLLNEIFLTVVIKFNIPNTHKVVLFASIIILTTLVYSYYRGFTLYYLLWSSVIIIRGYAYRFATRRIDSISFALIIFICALIASIKLSNFETIKEQETRMAFIKKLETPDDATADAIFKKIEHQIITDSSITRFFSNSLHNSEYLKTRLQKLYLNGYLTKFDFTVHEFGPDGQPLSEDKNYTLSVYKNLVLYSSFKVSNYFYRENESFGSQSYFAILPIIDNDKNTGTIVIGLTSKPVQSTPSFPGLLIDGQTGFDNRFNGYSYAYYTDDKLLNQSGSYVYDLINTDLKGKNKAFVLKSTEKENIDWRSRFITYNHLIYKPTERNLIVVSKEENAVMFGVTSVTFFYFVFLAFSVLILFVRWLWIKIKLFNITNKRISWNIKFNFDKVLYKTRIQFSMVFAVMITLILVGFITYFSISNQFQAQQNKNTRDKLHNIAIELENGPYDKYLTHVNEASLVDFIDFANSYSTDLTLFDLNGVPLATTQPKIYEFGLVARRMNSRAFIALSKQQKSEFENEETIGKLHYKTAYMPLRTPTNETIAYLQLPYFSNEADYKERIGSLLNIMINVYALIFIAIGLFAIIIARQITAPLSFIQHTLSKTIYGKKNEAIRWDRNDEIGALVKEYNKMIGALEDSAQRLAQSERESAWREMAKQVAHEIKNPLTPLKLGLQLLDKSWRDKDPKFDQKFERFSKSFVEQIESLSTIASEFSAFAKMPDTRLQHVNLFDILTQAIVIFKQMDNIQILFHAPEEPFTINADRDQLLRCFNNLLKNAIEAAPEDRLGVIDINYMITSKNILLTLKDNGQGIPENVREKIFQPNFTTKSSGTGLGLAFVKNSIENAGGKVWFETIMGVGTTFYISLPAV